MTTAEFRRLSLLAAEVDASQIPPILDTATYRNLMVAAIAGRKDSFTMEAEDGSSWRITIAADGSIERTKL